MPFQLKPKLPLHLILYGYCLLTIVLSLSQKVKLENAWMFYSTKIMVLAIIISWPFLVKHCSAKCLNFINVILGIGFLGFFYNETGQLNQILFAPIDPYLVNLEQALFGIQPSIYFSVWLPGLFMTELMNLGYLSYYFIVVCFVFIIMYRKPLLYNQILFLICQSFIIYYLIFIIIPSWGPQFYFKEPMNLPTQGIFFQKILVLVQQTGEARTGAIPSSHVGITLIILLLAYRHLRGYFWVVFPMALILFCSTVYIKAHYLIDVLAGLISAPLILWLSNKIWDQLNRLYIYHYGDNH